VKPSGVFFIAPDLLRSLGKRFPCQPRSLSVWHVGRDVHQAHHGWICARFSNYGTPIAMSDKNAWSILQSRELGGGDVVFKGGFRCWTMLML